ncbi:DUF4429 domain-containing protein [Actinomadura sp. KC06]|uniref:DUF4429 domain-containing protein n=1 Tax=Actinomadura sp. KC06 TaxID=2530369 RepID=UPI001042D212|nr:DUF4429 domain-containing protein [Actinomadura sp. KC06]TDD35756.1 DUF4429 domain-containing protein [Actinomadura sp. KC06]
MAEIIGSDGTWTFDGEVLRIVPGHGRGVHRLRRLLGELTVPLAAVAGIAVEPGSKGGVLRVRLRQGADPLLQAAAGALNDVSDPYRLNVEGRRTSVAEYLVDEVRNALLIEEIGGGPVDRYLLPGPDVPIRASGGDGSAAFDGESVRLEWNWMAEAVKKEAGPQHLPLRNIASVELHPAIGLDNGHLRFRVDDGAERPEPILDPRCVMLWGFKKEAAAAIALAAAVVARLPHPNAVDDPPPDAVDAPPSPPELQAAPADDHDALLRRLRELGDLHKEGILTEEEFTAAKQAVLRRM